LNAELEPEKEPCRSGTLYWQIRCQRDDGGFELMHLKTNDRNIKVLKISVCAERVDRKVSAKEMTEIDVLKMMC
jgi:hypothetical protein